MRYTAFPKKHWKRIRTTDIMKWVNEELKRKTKGFRHVPKRGSFPSVGWIYSGGYQRGVVHWQKFFDPGRRNEQARGLGSDKLQKI